MYVSESKIVARLPWRGIARGVGGPVGDNSPGGGTGSGFARLSWKLKLRPCCLCVEEGKLEDKGAEVVAFSMAMKGSDGRRKPICEGWRDSLAISSRPGVILLMPRKAEEMSSEGDLDEGDRSDRPSFSESEKRLESPAA